MLCSTKAEQQLASAVKKAFGLAIWHDAQTEFMRSLVEQCTPARTDETIAPATDPTDKLIRLSCEGYHLDLLVTFQTRGGRRIIANIAQVSDITSKKPDSPGLHASASGLKNIFFTHHAYARLLDRIPTLHNGDEAKIKRFIISRIHHGHDIGASLSDDRNRLIEVPQGEETVRLIAILTRTNYESRTTGDWMSGHLVKTFLTEVQFIANQEQSIGKARHASFGHHLSQSLGEKAPSRPSVLPAPTTSATSTKTIKAVPVMSKVARIEALLASDALPCMHTVPEALRDAIYIDQDATSWVRSAIDPALPALQGMSWMSLMQDLQRRLREGSWREQDGRTLITFSHPLIPFLITAAMAKKTLAGQRTSYHAVSFYRWEDKSLIPFRTTWSMAEILRDRAGFEAQAAIAALVHRCQGSSPDPAWWTDVAMERSHARSVRRSSPIYQAKEFQEIRHDVLLAISYGIIGKSETKTAKDGFMKTMSLTTLLPHDPTRLLFLDVALVGSRDRPVTNVIGLKNETIMKQSA